MTTTQSKQEFRFVNCSGKPEKDKRRNITSIRKHVMHDYFKKKEQIAAKTAPVNTGSSGTKATTGRSDHPEPHSSMYHHGYQPLEADSTEPTRLIKNLVSRLVISTPSKTGTTDSTRAEECCPTQLGASPGAHQSDPFDTLPVKQIPDGLVEWFPCLYEGDVKNASWIHRSNVIWAQNIWHSSMQDKGLFYTVLSQAERNRMVMTQSKDNRRYLYLRGQALQALRQRIADSANDSPNSLILLIAYQIRFAIVEGDFATARTHLQAASVLIAQEGDKIGPFVQVHATLMDVKLAAASWTRPLLGFKDPHLRLHSSPRLIEVVQKRTRISLAHFPLNFRGPEAEEAMTGLHWHFLKFDARYGKDIDGSTTVLLNCVRTARHVRTLAADAWEAEAESAKARCSNVKPRPAIILCMEFFAWMHDPAHIIPWIIHSEFMKRLGENVRGKLRHCLDVDRADLEHAWEATGASRESLLWVLMIGFVMTANTEAEADGFVDTSLPFLHAMHRVMLGMRIFDQERLEQALKMFPWTDDFCGTWSKSIITRLGIPATVREKDSLGLHGVQLHVLSVSQGRANL